MAPVTERRSAEDVEIVARIDERVTRLEHLVARQEGKLDEVLQLLHASKLGLSALRGLIYLGLAIIGGWAAIKGIR